MASTVGVVLCGPSSSLRSQEGVGVLVGCWGLVAGEIRRVCLCVCVTVYVTVGAIT
jgi:hypothetical protein